MPRSREPPALRIRDVDALCAQVRLKDAVLLPQIGDHFKLSAIYPSCEGHEQNPPTDVEHPPSLLATSALG
jgi:hypothetical protein